MRSKYPFYLLCFTIFFAPIPLGANRPWAWGIIEVLIALNTVLTCYTHSFLTVFEQLKRIKVILGVIFIVQIWVFLQWLGGIAPNLSMLHSLDPSQTEIALIKGISLCLFIINFAVLVNKPQRIKVICWAIMLSGLFQAVYAIFLQFSGWQTSLLGFGIGHRATGSFIYQNHLANYLLLCLCMAIGYLIGSLSGVEMVSRRAKFASAIETLLSPKWIVRITIIIMVVGLIMTRSRMGNSAFFISLLATSFIALLLMKRTPNTLKWLIASLIILDMVIVGTYFGVEKVKERLQTTSLQSETRDDVVRDAIPFIKDVWQTGTGAGSFYSSFPKYQSTEYQMFYDHAHNEYVQFLIEFGLVPSLCLLAMLLYIIWSSLVALRQSKNKRNQGLALGCLMACIAMLMHSSVDFVFQDFAIVMVFLSIILLTLLCTDLNKHNQNSKKLINL